MAQKLKVYALIEPTTNNGFIVEVLPQENAGNEFLDFFQQQIVPIIEKLQKFEDNDTSEDWKKAITNEAERIEAELQQEETIVQFLGKHVFVGNDAL